MSILPFRPRKHPVEVSLSDAMGISAEEMVSASVRLSDAILSSTTAESLTAALPSWVREAGYRAVAYHLPLIGQLFYCGVRDKILKLVEDVETHPFIIVEYEGICR